jgi:hypothetical protein
MSALVITEAAGMGLPEELIVVLGTESMVMPFNSSIVPVMVTLSPSETLLKKWLI